MYELAEKLGPSFEVNGRIPAKGPLFLSKGEKCPFLPLFLRSFVAKAFYKDPFSQILTYLY